MKFFETLRKNSNKEKLNSEQLNNEEMNIEVVTDQEEQKRPKYESRVFGRKGRKAMFIVIAVFVLIGLALMFMGAGKVTDLIEGDKEGRTDITIIEVQGVLEEIGELATYSYRYSGYTEMDNTRTFLGINIPLTTHTMKISYDGVIKVGYKVSDMGIEVNNVTKLILITLPEENVTDNILNEEGMTIEEENNILNPISSDEVARCITEIKRAEMQQAVEKGIYDKAEEHVKEIIENLMKAFNGYTVVFR